MAQPSTRGELIDYCKRQLGAPVLEINVADEQIEDIVDDAIQYFQERHFDGVAQTYMKYKVTQDDIDRGKGPGSTGVVGLTTTSATADIAGTSVQFDYTENSNYLGHANPSIKWVYYTYGPVWVGHKAIRYALHMSFDIYMSPLESIFHFPAIVSILFMKVAPKMTPS